jgi:hypothetical protein
VAFGSGQGPFNPCLLHLRLPDITPFHPAIAYYRRRDASCPEEKECIENLFDALCSCLLLPENQARFRQVRGGTTYS